ncbi:calcium/sodium antiporter [Candidatus Nanosyncoccus nanoralicus]|uniref:Inner membrane protein YrbG n=1 Tax=Candidatus Nanosyncoccus nanoralicus TaxID=2171996 RepID=A0ABY0FKG5_9BACT|nr:calcium/sodium antiporter [Candidatus Nanosyncoccus nanoralicus]RYC73892.1 Inner membrane protein YrbG [Candidatus Nanosyncoccus nanoralicus]
MGLLINLALLLIGFVFLIKGADIFVDGASDTARKFRVPKMLIGLTIVSFGTSAPEFAVSIQSILSGKGDILLGNVVGSNILNILLILGISSLVGTLRVNTATVKKEIPVLVLITLAFAALLSDKIFGLAENVFTRQDGIVLLLFFCIFIYYLIGMARKKDTNEEENKDEKPVKLVKALLMIVIGLFGIVLGSDFVVKGASEIAATFGVSQRIISLTIVALGTSLPELVTSVIATKKGEYDIAIGNIVGSNIFNIGIVAGLPVAIFGGVGGGAFSYIDIIALIISAVVLFFFARHGGRIGYKKGIIFLLMFAAYYGYVMMGSFA